MNKIIFVLIVLMSGPLFASGECNGHGNCTNDDVIVDTQVTSGDVNVGGDKSKALGLSHSLGDVDINECMGSTQWSTIIGGKQKLVLNKWCAAEAYDIRGLHKMAGRLRCTIPEIESLFKGDLEGCLLENTVVPASGGIATDIPIPGPDEDGYRPDEAVAVSQSGGPGSGDYDLVQRQLTVQGEAYETLEERIARIERGNQIAAQKRRAYAQETIEKLVEDDDEN